jgi:hypothetical protein
MCIKKVHKYENVFLEKFNSLIKLELSIRVSRFTRHKIAFVCAADTNYTNVQQYVRP